MLRGWKRFAVLSASLTGLIGCKKSPSPPPAGPEATQSAQTGPSLPTTQDLLSGPFDQINLRPLPLKAQVPRSWGIETLGDADITLLHGPGPAGTQLHIQLGVLMSMNAQRMNGILQAAQHDAQNDPSIIHCNVRQQGDMQILDVLRLLPAATQPKDQPIDWKITYFVQSGLDYDAYVLSIIGITQNQYDQSKALLNKIINSVTYNKPGG